METSLEVYNKWGNTKSHSPHEASGNGGKAVWVQGLPWGIDIFHCYTKPSKFKTAPSVFRVLFSVSVVTQVFLRFLIKRTDEESGIMKVDFEIVRIVISSLRKF
jgi:hypothetical protein